MAGRPKKGEEHKWHEAFLAALAQEPNVSKACRAAGVSRRAAYAQYHKAEKDDNNKFNELWDDAIESGLDGLEEILVKIGTGEIRYGNATAIIYLLNVRRYAKRSGTDTPTELTLKWGSPALATTE